MLMRRGLGAIGLTARPDEFHRYTYKQLSIMIGFIFLGFIVSCCIIAAFVLLMAKFLIDNG